jgi:hypothetical protein
VSHEAEVAGEILDAVDAVGEGAVPAPGGPLLDPPPSSEETHEPLMNPWPGHDTRETIGRNRGRTT